MPLLEFMIAIALLSTLAIPVIIVLIIIKSISMHSQKNKQKALKGKCYTYESSLEEEREHERFVREHRPKSNYPYLLVDCVLTNREHVFYRELKQITDELGYLIFPKMRIADLVEIPKDNENYYSWFGKIKSKHIDFTICDKQLHPRLLIELDDSTHYRYDRIKRDDFVNEVFHDLDIELYHVWEGDKDLRGRVYKGLGIKTYVAEKKDETEA